MDKHKNNISPKDGLPDSLKTFQGFDEFQIFTNLNEEEWRMPFEWHEQLEVFYVLSGRGQFYIDNKTYMFEPGDLFVIGNQELHKSQLINNEPFEAKVLMFNRQLAETDPLQDEVNLLSLFEKREPGFSHCLRVNEPLKKKLEFGFSQLQEHYDHQNRYSSQKIKSLLQWILLEIKEGYEDNSPYSKMEDASHVHFKPVVSKAMEYIAQYYAEEITLDRIADFIGVNSSYLSRVFKQNSGFSVVEFITFKRIWRAKEMLLYTNQRITDIAHSVGFNNVTHFQWTFKKMFDMSPGQYRKSPRNYYHLEKY